MTRGLNTIEKIHCNRPIGQSVTVTRKKQRNRWMVVKVSKISAEIARLIFPEATGIVGPGCVKQGVR